MRLHARGRTWDFGQIFEDGVFLLYQLNKPLFAMFDQDCVRHQSPKVLAQFPQSCQKVHTWATNMDSAHGISLHIIAPPQEGRTQEKTQRNKKEKQKRQRYIVHILVYRHKQVSHIQHCACYPMPLFCRRYLLSGPGYKSGCLYRGYLHSQACPGHAHLGARRASAHHHRAFRLIALLISTKRVPHQPALASASGSLVLLLANLKTGSPCGGRRGRRGHIQERRGRRGARPHHAVEMLLLPMHHPDAVTANTMVGLMADMIWKSSCIVGAHVFKFCMEHVVLYSEADRFCQLHA